MVMEEDLIGQRIGMLTVLSEVEPGIDARGHPLRRFMCRCDCGTEKVVLYTVNKSTFLLVYLYPPPGDRAEVCPVPARLWHAYTPQFVE